MHGNRKYYSSNLFGSPPQKKSHQITEPATHVLFKTQLQTSGHHLRTRSGNQLHEAQSAAQQANQAKILATQAKTANHTASTANQKLGRHPQIYPTAAYRQNSSLYGTESNHCHPTKAKRKPLI
ncbi:hypothetical protein HMPREF0766_14248 [Sphingobacterium spiritivorum ATCC 33861]|uniref:Uncharacterized protein n=1 Tax=Sphingobacterium spiritivorum ATCC 33861 TaxID=525373 RepID=D7VTE4_SPHSI|nr:hypothetical protein HMPREF0766_14248 [Sphingobacterium spiritivorum ATCC 33861]